MAELSVVVMEFVRCTSFVEGEIICDHRPKSDRVKILIEFRFWILRVLFVCS